MRSLVVLLIGLAVVSAVPRNGQRIVGGSLADISQYPEMVSMIFALGSSGHRHECGGTILNSRTILTAAHCTYGSISLWWQSRVGSNYANSGGTVYHTQEIINHPGYNFFIFDNDVSVIRTATPISFNNNVRAGRIAGANYNLGDNQVVWATGWGRIFHGGPPSEELRHVQVWTVNQAICRQRYAEFGDTVTDNMLCSGWLDVGGRDQCLGDSGGPLFHHGVVVGVCSWGNGCASPYFPGVNARVTRFSNWIAQNA